ncbi:MAG: hypothetical protein ABGX16_13940 [Pirellulales bacterium]
MVAVVVKVLPLKKLPGMAEFKSAKAETVTSMYAPGGNVSKFGGLIVTTPP